MNDPEDFISRWSRRKREAAAGDAQRKQPDAGEAHIPGEQAKAESREPAAPLPEFDISNLPPIETIDARTDITVFMQPGVPAAMRHAALRRAWSADPAIRDFMGPTENYWDAVGPEGVPGFGDLDPSLDVKRLVSELFGETRGAESAQRNPQQEISSGNSDTQRTDMPSGGVPPPATESNLSQRSENVATHKDSPDSVPTKKIARRHGGAMPQ